MTGCLKCLLKEVRRQCEFLAAFKQRENGRKRKKMQPQKKEQKENHAKARKQVKEQ